MIFPENLVTLNCFHIGSATRRRQDLRRQHGLCDGLQVLLLLLPNLASYRTNNDFEERIRSETKNKFNSTVYAKNYSQNVKVRYLLRIGVKRINNLLMLSF